MKLRKIAVMAAIPVAAAVCGCSSSGSSNPDAAACSAVLSDLSASSPAAGSNLAADAQLTQTNTLYQAANAYTVGSATGASGTVSQVVTAGGGAPAIAVIQATCGSS